MADAPIHLGKGLSLPLEVVTQTFGIVAKRGSGKTETAVVMSEEMIGAGQQVVAIDPVGVWWGLRSSADGKKAGLEVVILGGDHGDVPLEPTAGAVIADLIVDTGISAVIDLSGFSKKQTATFVADFAERLYRRNRSPLHLIIDEADAFAPQRTIPGQERMLGAIDTIVRRGRARGLGVTLITQRPAVLNKDVLTQVEVLVALRITGPQDRKAIDEWVKHHGDQDLRDQMMRELAGLPIGTAFVWSPGWLEIFVKVAIRRRRTFDSSATPKVGERRVEPKARADVDLGALREQMAATIERAEADDPKVLRRRIRDLEAQLADARADVPEPVVERVEVPVLDADDLARIDTVETAVAEVAERFDELAALRQALAGIRGAGEGGDRGGGADVRVGSSASPPRPPPQRPRPAAPPPPAPPGTGSDSGGITWADLGKAERKLLEVLAQFPAGRTRVQVALLSGYSVKSSSLSNALGRLRALDLATKGTDPIRATPEGLAVAGDVDPAPTGPELLEHWRGRLGRAERAVLDAIVAAEPNELTRDELAEASGYSASSSSLSNALGKLRSLELVQGFRVSEDLL